VASDLLLTRTASISSRSNYRRPEGHGAAAHHPDAYHEDRLVDALAAALIDVWRQLDSADGSRAGGGVIFTRRPTSDGAARGGGS